MYLIFELALEDGLRQKLNGDSVFLGKFDHSLNPWRGFALLHNQSVATTFRG
jgi:hypothetical protein